VICVLFLRCIVRVFHFFPSYFSGSFPTIPSFELCTLLHLSILLHLFLLLTTGLSLASTGSFKEAEEALLLVQSEKYKKEYIYLSWLARCHIHNGNPRAAWELYLKMDTSTASFNLLQLIANDCYRMGAFLIAAKAFDVLERLDPDPEYWEGKRGACVGVFQAVVAGKAHSDELRDVLALVRQTTNPQVEYMVRIMRKWCNENGVKLV